MTKIRSEGVKCEKNNAHMKVLYISQTYFALSVASFFLFSIAALSARIFLIISNLELAIESL